MTPEEYRAERARLAGERAETVRKASELAEKAKGRAFTPEETTEASRLTTAVADVDRQLTELDAKELRRRDGVRDAEAEKRRTDNALREQMREWGQKFGLEDPGAESDPATKTGERAGRPDAHRWGKAVVKARTDQVTGFKAIVGSGGVPVSVPLDPDPVRDNVPVNRLRSLIPTKPNSTGQWAYLRQTLREWNAAAVPVGARKPTSKFTLDRVNSDCKTVAHLSEPIARDYIADAPLLEDFIDVEMRDGLEAELERLIIEGTGTGAEWTGLRNVSGTQVQNYETGLLLTTRRAVTKLQAQEIVPTGWVLHPTDWENIEMVATAAGNLIVTEAGERAPIDQATRRLWSTPVALSTQATVGEGWLVDFAGSTEMQVREEAHLDWSENVYRPDAPGTGVGASDWERNMISWRAEGRFDFACKRPLGVVKVDLSE